MNLKTSIMALGVMCGLAIFSGPAAAAKSQDTTITVKQGDTLSSLAKEHDTTYARLFDANKDIVNPDMIDVGDKIRVPKKDEKLPERFKQYSTAVAVTPTVYASTPTTYTTRSYSSAPVDSTSYYVGNGMWCTDYVHSKRPDVAVYGNAGYNWVGAAEAEGKSTGSTPKAGAVAVTNGHVAYVERVNKDGSFVVSEMGWNYQAGNYNERTVSTSDFGKFIY